MHNTNSRLETFCDGVFAIAITLLILEIKTPPLDSIHSIADLWNRLGNMWPSWFAFTLSFLVILISWVNHHNLFKVLDKSSAQFMYANGFFLLTLVILPFPTALIAEYINTAYAQPAIVFYCFSSLFHNIGWNVLFLSTLKPDIIVKDDNDSITFLKQSFTSAKMGFVIYFIVTMLAFWFPKTAMIINTILWCQWIGMGLAVRRKKNE